MEYKDIVLDGFQVIGIAVRTTNANNLSQKDISELWEQFQREDVKNKIPSRLSDDIYCLYTDYESNFMGKYTTILGVKVSQDTPVPERMVGKNVPAQRYQVYQSDGKIPECVAKTWVYIWLKPDSERNYSCDFDVYDSTLTDINNSTVRTYLSVK